jgi:hypothetical protein
LSLEACSLYLSSLVAWCLSLAACNLRLCLRLVASKNRSMWLAACRLRLSIMSYLPFMILKKPGH